MRCHAGFGMVARDGLGSEVTKMANETRIVITGIGLTAPNGNNLSEFRENLLAGKSGIGKNRDPLHGRSHSRVCDFDPLIYQKKKALRRGTRAGSIAVSTALMKQSPMRN